MKVKDGGEQQSLTKLLLLLKSARYGDVGAELLCETCLWNGNRWQLQQGKH
jgi:hypothetical protein